VRNKTIGRLEGVAEHIVPVGYAPKQVRGTGVTIVQVPPVSAPEASDGLGSSSESSLFQVTPYLCINQPQQRTVHGPTALTRRRRDRKCGDATALCPTTQDI
jgi:hypothetical protein